MCTKPPRGPRSRLAWAGGAGRGGLALDGGLASETSAVCASRAEARDGLRLLAPGVAGALFQHRHDHQAGGSGQGERGRGARGRGAGGEAESPLSLPRGPAGEVLPVLAGRLGHVRGHQDHAGEDRDSG